MLAAGSWEEAQASNGLPAHSNANASMPIVLANLTALILQQFPSLI
jgi:hypothetical protein